MGVDKIKMVVKLVGDIIRFYQGMRIEEERFSSPPQINIISKTFKI